MKKIALLVMMTILVACGKSVEEQRLATMNAIQPCLAQGVDIDRCTQAYNGRAPGDSTNWLGLATAAVAGAALNHALTNKPATPVYAPNYGATLGQQPLVAPQQTVPQVQQPVKTPELNKATLIPNQKVQPLFAPTTIAKSLTPVKQPTILTKTASVFKPSSPAKRK